MRIYNVRFTLSTGFGTNSHIEIESESQAEALRTVWTWIREGEMIGTTRDEASRRTDLHDRGVILNPDHVVGLFVDLD